MAFFSTISITFCEIVNPFILSFLCCMLTVMPKFYKDNFFLCQMLIWIQEILKKNPLAEEQIGKTHVILFDICLGNSVSTSLTTRSLLTIISITISPVAILHLLSPSYSTSKPFTICASAIITVTNTRHVQKVIALRLSRSEGYIWHIGYSDM